MEKAIFNRGLILLHPEPANAGHAGEPEYNHCNLASEGWEVEIGGLTMWVLRARGIATDYIVTITEGYGGEGVEVGFVKGYSDVKPLIEAIRKIKGE